MEGAAVVRGLQTILMKRERGAVRGGGQSGVRAKK